MIESVFRNPTAAVDTTQLAERVMAGDIIVVRGLLQSIGWLGKLVEVCRTDLVDLVGARRADAVIAARFERLHAQLSIDEIFTLNRTVMRHLSPMAPLLVRDFAHQVLKRRGTFAECNPNARTIVPQDVSSRQTAAFKAVHRARGAGKVTLHGPHYDSWHRHPLNTINLWCAIGPVRDGNGMVIFPDMWEKHLPCDSSGTIRRDQMLGGAVNFSLDPGDAVLFHANHLHGSEVNRTEATRFVVSMRMTIDRPVVPGEHAYRYVYTDWVGSRLDRWARLRVQLSGSYIRFRAIRLLKRLRGATLARYSVGHQVGFPVTYDTSSESPPPVAVTWDDSHQECLLPADALRVNEIRPINDEFCVARTVAGYVLFGRRCPHEGADLLGGRISDDGRLMCPWHNLTFDTKTGRSPCNSMDGVRVVHGTVENVIVRFKLGNG